MASYSSDELVKDDFLFVSYRHNDKMVVHGVVSALIEMGVRLWYDTDLSIGDNWNERVADIIKHENCMGALFFNSTDAFFSEPISKERALVIEKRSLLSARGKTFPVIPINIGGVSTMQIIKSVFDALPNDRTADAKFPLKYLKDIAELFGSETLYASASEDNIVGCAQNVFDAIEKNIPTAIDISRIKLKNISKTAAARTCGELPIVSLGKYKNAPSSAVPAYLLDGSGRITYKDEEYIVDGGAAFTLYPIDWICIYCDGDETVMISQSIIELKNGGADLIKWLNSDFKASAFTDKEAGCLCSDISLLSMDDIAKADSSCFMSAGASERISEAQWWLGAFSMGIMQKVVREDGTVYANGYNSRMKKCGVRPVIRVCMSKFTSL